MSAGDMLVTIDVGTSGARAAAFDLDGGLVGEARRSYPTMAPRPGWSEQDARAWQSASLGALGDLVRRLRTAGNGAPIRAIGLTGQCPSVVLVDGRGEPLGPGLIYRDNRATTQAAAIRERLGDREIHRRTGHLPAAFHIAPKLIWLREHEPALFARARLALQPRDLVARALTGEVATDGTHAAATLVFDLGAGAWAADLLAGVDLAPDLFPPVRASTAVLGSLRSAFARRLGLGPVAVVLGGADSQACALGAGVVEPGPVSEMAGSSTCLNAVVGAPLAELLITHYPHVIPGSLTTETGINTTGAAVAWVADTFYARPGRPARAADFVRLDSEAGREPAGARSVVALPVLADGERTDPDLRGAFVGISLGAGRATLARAMLEGVAHEIRSHLDLLRRAGAPATELRVSGGDARLASWNRIKADILGIPVTRIASDAAAVGVAMLAGLGVGIYRDAAEAIDRCVHPDVPIEPDPSTREVYEAGHAAYRSLVSSAAVRWREG
ncbi:MAG: FGGY family carbohydrate kinase [Chloroflexota bacterium]|nr:FGGY family carbohydrate kinase [Chloroflexota bacterium]